MTTNELQVRVKEALQPLAPEQIIMFGSRVRGEESVDSDVDLVVVLPVGVLPKDYAEKMMYVRQVRERLEEMNKDYAFDVLVFTRPEWERVQKARPLFAAEILNEGRRIA